MPVEDDLPVNDPEGRRHVAPRIGT